MTVTHKSKIFKASLNDMILYDWHMTNYPMKLRLRHAVKRYKKLLVSMPFLPKRERQVVYLLLEYDNEQCKVLKVYKSRYMAERAQMRLTKRVIEDLEKITYHVIEKDLLGDIE